MRRIMFWNGPLRGKVSPYCDSISHTCVYPKYHMDESGKTLVKNIHPSTFYYYNSCITIDGIDYRVMLLGYTPFAPHCRPTNIQYEKEDLKCRICL